MWSAVARFLVPPIGLGLGLGLRRRVRVSVLVTVIVRVGRDREPAFMPVVVFFREQMERHEQLPGDETCAQHEADRRAAFDSREPVSEQRRLCGWVLAGRDRAPV